jgi:ERCC4-type nuclease
MFVSQSLVKQRLINPKPENMKQIITLIAATFIFATANASVTPYITPVKINAEKAALKVSLEAAGKVNIMWTAAEKETTTTIYEIQKRTEAGEFKTIAILMGESFPTYSYREKINITSGTIEYRVVISDNNETVSTVSQQVVVL